MTDPHIQALLRGPSLTPLGGPGTPVVVTYSFMTGAPGEAAAMDGAQQAAARDAFAAWGAVSGIIPVEVPSIGGAAGGQIRLGIDELPGSQVALAALYGDGRTIITLDGPLAAAGSGPGSLATYALLHEIGHALGLKHPFEGGAVLPAALDSSAHTVMSYNYRGFLRADPGPLDAAAAAHLYGAPAAKAGLAAWWDAASGAVAIAGTPGPDRVEGSALPVNVIATGAGDDAAFGGRGGDFIAAGEGNDLLAGGAGSDHLDGGGGFDVALFAGPRSSYAIGADGATITVAGPDGIDRLTQVEWLQFADGGQGGPPAAPVGMRAERLLGPEDDRAWGPPGADAASALAQPTPLAPPDHGFG
ncbi:MAG TPA: hypothetical protein VEH84_19560 [Alphaproteobacteria bacterium]|nr:hypothetical protein [Alphaproteobacteria bacterium]